MPTNAARQSRAAKNSSMIVKVARPMKRLMSLLAMHRSDYNFGHLLFVAIFAAPSACLSACETGNERESRRIFQTGRSERSAKNSGWRYARTRDTCLTTAPLTQFNPG